MDFNYVIMLNIGNGDEPDAFGVFRYTVTLEDANGLIEAYKVDFGRMWPNHSFNVVHLDPPMPRNRVAHG
jgi:hypothetical protein